VFNNRDELINGAQEMALNISKNSPLAVQASKNVLNYQVGKSVEEGLKYVASVSSNIIPSNDLFEAVAAFAEKRPPEFKGSNPPSCLTQSRAYFIYDSIVYRSLKDIIRRPHNKNLYQITGFALKFRKLILNFIIILITDPEEL
jgi:hypothetical protein